jgi:hypothetical protein
LPSIQIVGSEQVEKPRIELPPAWFPLRPHPIQHALWNCDTRFAVVAAGRGSGKTEIARRKVVRELRKPKEWDDPKYFYALPTYNQAERVAWGKLKALVPENWIYPGGKIYETDLIIRTNFGAELYLIGMDKPQRAEGVQWDGGIIDESADQKPGLFNLTLRPAMTHRQAWCWRIGVPKRAGVGAAEFRQYFRLAHETPNVSAFTWTSEDILPPDEIEEIKRTTDPRDYAEQYLASFENASGAVFYAFLNRNQLDAENPGNISNLCVYHQTHTIVVGSDFNVDPMCWVLGHVMEVPGIGKMFFVFDEVFLRNTNTRQTMDYLYSKYGNHPGGWLFIGDATGKARRSSASESDYLIIKGDTRFKKANVAYPNHNPKITDRFAACNAMFLNQLGQRRMLISPKCKHLIEDLETRAYKPGTNEPNDSHLQGHISDALGYVIHVLFPIRLTHGGSMRVGSIQGE